MIRLSKAGKKEGLRLVSLAAKVREGRLKAKGAILILRKGDACLRQGPAVRVAQEWLREFAAATAGLGAGNKQPSSSL